MAATRVSEASANTNTVSMPTHQAGDLIIAFAYRDGSTTAPSLPAGWENINNSGANTNSARIAYKIARSNGETTGTWTNANFVAVVVWRNHGGIGATNVGGASGSTITYPALATLTNYVPNTSRILRFMGHRTATNQVTNTPSGYQSVVGDASNGRAIESTGTVTSVAGDTQSVNASSGWRAYSIEILEEYPFERLSEEFDKSSTVDSNVWVNWGGANVSIVSGQLNINTGSAADDFFGMETLRLHSLIGSSIAVQVVNAGTQHADYSLYPIELVLMPTSTDYQVYWEIVNGTAHAQKNVNGSFTDLANVAHVNGMWYRIRESGGTTYWEYSTDGLSWTTLHSEANPIPLTAMVAVTFTERRSAFAATTAILDNYNLDGWTTLASDDFNRADGDPGSNWDTDDSASVPAIVSNKLAIQADFVDGYAWWKGAFSPATANYRVKATTQMVHATEYADGEIMARYADSSNYYSLMAWVFGDEMQIYKYVAGVQTLLAAKSYPSITRNTDMVLKLQVRGTHLKGYVDGVLVVEAVDSAISAAGKPGVAAEGHASVVQTFDDFSVIGLALASQIKKFMGVTQATIKKVSGVTNATMKKLEGVANT